MHIFHFTVNIFNLSFKKKKCFDFINRIKGRGSGTARTNNSGNGAPNYSSLASSPEYLSESACPLSCFS